jgi:hypothetical protein
VRAERPSILPGPSELRIKQRLSLQQQASQGKQSVRDAAQGAAVRVTGLAKRSIPGTTLGITLAGDTRPVIDRIAQSNMRSIAHDDDARLATAPGDRRGTTQCPECLIVAAAERPRSFTEQRREVDPADTGHGSEDQDVVSSKTFSRSGFGLAKAHAELFELVLGRPQLAIDHTQASDQRAQVNAGRFGNAVWIAGSCNVPIMVSASRRRMRCCLSSRSTVGLRSWRALAGVGAMVQSSRNHGAARSSVSFRICG